MDYNTINQQKLNRSNSPGFRSTYADDNPAVSEGTERRMISPNFGMIEETEDSRAVSRESSMRQIPEKEQLKLLPQANAKILNSIKLSLAIYDKINNFTHNNIDKFLIDNEIQQNSK